MTNTVDQPKAPSALVSYRRAGNGPGVLFIQGVGVIGEGWRPQLDGLGDRYTTISFDNQGLGETLLGPAPLTIEAMALDALAIMDAEKIEQFHVVGHSMGGLIAQEVALRAPARVKSLALLCTFARGKQATRLTPAIVLIGLRTRLGTRAMRRNAFLELVMPPALLATSDRAQLADKLKALFGRDLAEQPPIILKQLSAMAKYDASARLGQLASIPSLVLSAELDRIALPSFGRELAAAIPGARFVQLPGAGHGVPIHAPGEVNALLAEHFAAADRTATS
jgi:pimeloyl-ACP methyl ester carboxylesterase